MVKGLCKVGYHYVAIGLLRLIDHGTLGGGCKFDVVTYNIIFDSLCRDVVMIDYVFKLLKEMVYDKGVKPNVNTYNSLIYNLCKLSRWDEVCRMLKQMEDENIHREVKTFNIIINALCKQGKIDEAQAVIKIMDETCGKFLPDVVTYNSLIDGYCLRHEMTEAKRMFEVMDSRCIKPDDFSLGRLLLGYSMEKKWDEAMELDGSIYNGEADYLTSNLWLHHDYGFNITNNDSYIRALKFARYKHAATFVQLMDGSRLNSDTDVHVILIRRAMKARKFDQARRCYRDLILKSRTVKGWKHAEIKSVIKHGDVRIKVRGKFKVIIRSKKKFW